MAYGSVMEDFVVFKIIFFNLNYFLEKTFYEKKKIA